MMRSCCTALFPMVAAVLCAGLLTTHASAKAVVAKRTTSLTMSDLKHDFLTRAELLKDKEMAEEDEGERSARLDLELPPLVEQANYAYPTSDKFYKFIRGMGVNHTPEGYGNDMHLLQVLWELQQRKAGDEERRRRKHKPWEKRLEALANADSSAADLSLLEARRRGGPEFNPTGW